MQGCTIEEKIREQRWSTLIEKPIRSVVQVVIQAFNTPTVLSPEPRTHMLEPLYLLGHVAWRSVLVLRRARSRL